MNKKAIFVIIGLMGAAVIGIVALQMFWIKDAISIKQDEFDKSVFNALNQVAVKLQNAEVLREDLRVYQSINNISIKPEVSNVQKNSNGIGLEYSFAAEIVSKTFSNQKEFLAHMISDTCSCEKCQNARFASYQREELLYQKMRVEKMLYPKALSNRINLGQLHSFLFQELHNRGIDAENFQYGVFSNDHNSFVIADSMFLVHDTGPNAMQPGFKNLYESSYRVDLFPDDMKSPGLLMIHFPSRTSIVYGSVFMPLLMSILFTGIILFCFAYTIQVIFRQKKLSIMKTDFINNMTHEFKTPIATISLAADSITSPMISSKPDKVKRFADIIKQENKRMNAQVEKVLQMARIDRRDFNLKLTEINMHTVIAQAVENLGLQVEKKGGTITQELQATHPVIEGDLTHISSIIHNLLENANKYSPEHPKISVHTRNLSEGIEVIVKDQGIGMSKESKKHIFDAFYRVSTGNLHDVKGFGLGLSYVKAMVTAHDGQIDVKSELGKGSSFILTFPFKQ